MSVHARKAIPHIPSLHAVVRVLVAVLALAVLLFPRLATAAVTLGGSVCDAPVRSVWPIGEAEAHHDDAGARCEAPLREHDSGNAALGPEAGECGADGASRVAHAQPNPLNERAWLGSKCDGFTTLEGGCVQFSHGVAHLSSAADGPSPDAPWLASDAGVLPALVPSVEVAIAPPLESSLPELQAAGSPLRGARRGVDRPPRA